MKRLIIQTCLALLCASSAVFAYEPAAGRRAKYNFNSGWKLFVGDPAGAEQPGFDDSGWRDVTLPRAWNEDDAFRKDIKDLSTGVAWYRKRFRLPAGAGFSSSVMSKPKAVMPFSCRPTSRPLR